ncbi:hypothetical protein CAS74_005133 [Pichia kudriavzevii]|uniref:Uncharacterized protein n=2 Tax=Pichia kudriavzevii TaxID=4909 RepID=A0A1Z8JH00_PICKU|nr:hypothetical protein CAS74_005133 [Pichia kudriavzevii]
MSEFQIGCSTDGLGVAVWAPDDYHGNKPVFTTRTLADASNT